MSLPTINNESGFARYLQEIRKIPLLSADEEFMLAKRFVEHDDLQAAHKMVTSHLKLVAKIAMTFRNYGLPVIELVSEGNIGLMQAVKRFNPDLGFRLSTYAVWWIKASMQEYILKSWSLVKMGTTTAQKKLFFNLGKIKKRLRAVESRDLIHSDYKIIATELNVSEKDVIEMNMRMNGGDYSLNEPVGTETGEEMINMLPELRASQEEVFSQNQETVYKRKLFHQALEVLNDREKNIIMERRLKEEPTTLEQLSQLYNISRERVRQIEARAMEKLQNAVLVAAEA